MAGNTVRLEDGQHVDFESNTFGTCWRGLSKNQGGTTRQYFKDKAAIERGDYFAADELPCVHRVSVLSIVTARRRL